MQRFLLIHGIKPNLVPNPATDPMARRFVGKTPNGLFWDEGPIIDGKPLYPAAVACYEVVPDDPSIRKAIKNGEIKFIKQCDAQDIVEARKRLQPPVKTEK